MQGFSRNKGQPVKIDAASLEVRDKEKMATFSGNVQVIQGDTTLKTKTLVVHYEGESQGVDNTKTAKAATGIGPSGEQRIKRLEARGDVVVTQNDQVATGDLATFDMGTNMVIDDRQRGVDPGAKRAARPAPGGRYVDRLFADRVGRGR